MGVFLRVLWCALVVVPWTAAQTRELRNSQKSIAVTVTDSASAQADMATLHFAATSFGVSRESAYATNVIHANKILKAVTDAGIPKQDIETESVTISEADFREHPTWPKERPFSASQGWSVRVSAPQARNILDLVMQNGATEIGRVDWGVSDPSVLESKARDAALTHAQTVATEMAKRLGKTLGELIYASNTVSPDEDRLFPGPPPAMSAKLVLHEKAELRLFPAKVSESVTVYAVFAIN